MVFEILLPSRMNERDREDRSDEDDHRPVSCDGYGRSFAPCHSISFHQILYSIGWTNARRQAQPGIGASACHRFHQVVCLACAMYFVTCTPWLKDFPVPLPKLGTQDELSRAGGPCICCRTLYLRYTSEADLRSGGVVLGTSGYRIYRVVTCITK